MAVKIADTLKALSNTFPVAECIDIDVNINGTTKRLQKAIDDGDIGDGSDSTWKGTKEEWEALSTEEKGKIPTNGQFTTPSNCVEVLMSIKYGSKDSLNMHTV